MFSKMKDLYNLQKQAKAVKAQLAAIHIESEVDWVVVTMSAEMLVISIQIPDELMDLSKKWALQIAIVKAIEKAKKKAEEISAEKMKWVLWDMGMWGLPWMWG